MLCIIKPFVSVDQIQTTVLLLTHKQGYTHTDTLVPGVLRIYGVLLSCDQLGDGITVGTVGTLPTFRVGKTNTQSGYTHVDTHRQR